MATAVCRVCGVRKSFDLFNKLLSKGPLEDWNLKKCKDCTHREYMKRYADPKMRANQNVASTRWKQNNPDKHAALAVAYRLRHPDRIIAQNRLNYAVRKGRVIRGACEVCGTNDRIHAHHASYRPEDWYNVRWLCYVCHKLEHTDAEIGT